MINRIILKLSIEIEEKEASLNAYWYIHVINEK